MHNYDFVSASEFTPRELIIKKLDSKIKVVPVLDRGGRLLRIVSKRDFPLPKEKSVYIRARAPVRVSFGGGGSDLTHYFEEEPGAVINSTISIYSHSTLKVRNDSKIIIDSLDLGTTLYADGLEDALSQEDRSASFSLYCCRQTGSAR